MMKYCTNCGEKLKDTAKFCTKCGTPTRLELEKRKIEKEQKEDEKREKMLLNFGIILVIFASILFALLSWDKFSEIFKIGFLIGETILFFIMAFISKKINNKGTFKACYLLGVIFIPVILIMLNYYEFLGLYFNEGAGLYVYLSIISVICIILYYLSYKFIKSKLYVFLSSLSFIFFIIFFIKIFNFENYILLLALSIIILLFNILINKKILFKKSTNVLNVLLNITLIILLPIVTIELISNKDLKIINLFITIIYVLNLYIRCFLQKDTKLKYYVPFLVLYILIIYFSMTFDMNLALFLSLITAILIYLISVYLNNKAVKIISSILLFISILIILSMSSSLYKVLLVENVFIILFTFAMNKYDSKDITVSILKLVLPINILLVINSIFNMFFKLNLCEMFLVSSVVIFVLYLISKKLKKNISSVFEVYYIIYLILSTLTIFDYPIFKLPIILNTVVWIYYYIMNIIFNKNNLKHFFLIGSLISLIISLNYLHFNLYYILLGISIILFLSYELLRKKSKMYFIFGSIIVLLSILFDIDKYNIFSVVTSILLYIYSYYNLRKLNKYEPYRILYVISGFIFIYKLLKYLIDPIMIVSILALVIYIVILIIMYLADSEKNKTILLYSLMLLVPYFNIINNIELQNNLDYQFFILPFIIYTFVSAEFINFKSKNTKQTYLFVIILILSLGTISFDIETMVFSILLTISYLIYGMKNKMNMIINFSLVYFVISLIGSLYNTYDNIVIISLLLVLGLGIIIYTFIKELNKNKK